jgi:predicted secreted hydrolase
VLVGHAALSDPRRGIALHDQRGSPLITGRVEAREGRMDIHMDDWSLRKEAGLYVVSFPAREFALDLRLRPTQPPMLNGERGFSQKGPDPNLASHYYSVIRSLMHMKLRTPSIGKARSVPIEPMNLSGVVTWN